MRTDQSREVFKPVVVVTSRDGRTSPPIDPTPTQTEKADFEHKLKVAERHVPEGSGPALGELRTLVFVVSILAVIGVAGIGTILGAMFGWQAAAIGVAWVLMGYVVAWIVVWGAGLGRVKDEEEAAAHVIHGDVHPCTRPDQD